MLMTEAEARVKWCPMAKSIEGVNRAYGSKPADDCYCIASDCACWRCAEPITGVGYCGLAGKPEE